MESRIFRNFMNRFMLPPTPFVLIYLVSNLEKISFFLKTAVFNKQVSLLRCVYKEARRGEGIGDRIRLLIHCWKTAANSKS